MLTDNHVKSLAWWRAHGKCFTDVSSWLLLSRNYCYCHRLPYFSGLWRLVGIIYVKQEAVNRWSPSFYLSHQLPLSTEQGVLLRTTFSLSHQEISFFTQSNSLWALCKSRWTVRDLVNPLPISDTGMVTFISRGWIISTFFQGKSRSSPPQYELHVPQLFDPVPESGWLAGTQLITRTIRHEARKKQRRKSYLQRSYIECATMFQKSL